jgi:hypothetical protein
LTVTGRPSSSGSASTVPAPDPVLVALAAELQLAKLRPPERVNVNVRRGAAVGLKLRHQAD